MAVRHDDHPPLRCLPDAVRKSVAPVLSNVSRLAALRASASHHACDTTRARGARVTPPDTKLTAEQVIERSKFLRRRAERDGVEITGEDELALEFVRQFRHRYRSVPGWGWLRYEGTHWTRDQRLQHFDDARFICRMIGSFEECSPSEVRRLA